MSGRTKKGREKDVDDEMGLLYVFGSALLLLFFASLAHSPRPPPPSKMRTA